jgi:hypothetical protein
MPCGHGETTTQPTIHSLAAAHWGKNDQSGFRLAARRRTLHPRENAEKEMTMATTLREWGDLLVGNWTIQRTSPLAKGSLSVQSGSLAVSWTEGNTALEAKIVPAAGVSAGTFIATMDPASGQIKQNTVYPDGSTETTYISKVAEGQWSWKQTRNFANGQQETNSATFIVANMEISWSTALPAGRLFTPPWAN